MKLWPNCLLVIALLATLMADSSQTASASYGPFPVGARGIEPRTSRV